MLVLEFKKGEFKRYNNGKGYNITVDTSDKNKKLYSVFKVVGSANEYYLPGICIENYREDGKHTFEIFNNVNVNKTTVCDAITEIEKYLEAYKIAKESIAEFEKAIIENTL